MQEKSTKKRNRKAYLIAILIVTAGLIIYFMFRPTEEQISFVQNETIEIPFTNQGELFFIDQNSSDTLAVIEIEVSDTDEKRARGLMYRSSIPENSGMLFIQDYEEMQGFWMKNTYISLDMIFVNSENEIVTIHHNTTPLREWNYSSTEPAIYIVEVNGGFCNKNGIKMGDKIEFKITD